MYPVLLSNTNIFQAKITDMCIVHLVDWGSRIDRLYLWRDVTPHLQTNVLYMTLNCEASMLGMRRIPSLPSLPGPLRLAVQAPARVLSVVNWNCLTFKLCT